MLQIINEMKWHKLHDLGMHTSHSNCLSHSYFSRAFSLFVCALYFTRTIYKSVLVKHVCGCRYGYGGMGVLDI